MLDLTQVFSPLILGIITSYGLIHNGIKIRDGLITTVTINNLTPWSLHDFRVEACTSKGCSFGPVTSARTQEAPPQGVITLLVNVDDARSVNARWTSPSAANGFMYYDVMFTGLYYVDPGKWTKLIFISLYAAVECVVDQLIFLENAQ